MSFVAKYVAGFSDEDRRAIILGYEEWDKAGAIRRRDAR